MGFLQKIVKNETMKTDPPEIYGWRVFMLAASACFGGMLFGWDIGAIGGVLTLPAFKIKYGIDGLSKTAAATLSENIVSTLQGGCFFGCLAASPISDKWGRKPALIISAILAMIGIVMQTAASGSLPCMYIGRLVSGLGVGAASMLVPLYVSENSPRAIRGGLTGLYQLFIATGSMLSFWVNYGVSLNLTGESTYIIPLILQALPALLMLVGLFFCQESPRWLARDDQWEKAQSVLAHLRNLPVEHPYVQMELSEMRAQLEDEARLFSGATWMDLQKEMWLVPGNRKRAFLSMFLMCCQQMTGTNAINYYAPLIFNNLGIVGASAGLFATGIYGVVKMVTCAIFLVFVADSLGRRRSLLWTAIGQSFCMFLVGAYIYTNPPKTGAPIPPFGYVALVLIYLYAAFFQFGWGPVCWIYVSEIPTARLRSMNVSLAAAVQWLFNFVVARTVPTMLATVGKDGYGTYFIFGSFCFSMFFFVYFFIPDTKGMSLEKMDELFGVTELVHKLDQEDGGKVGPTTIENVSNVDEKSSITEKPVGESRNMA